MPAISKMQREKKDVVKLIKTHDGFVDLKASFGKTYRIFAEDWWNHRQKPHLYFAEQGIAKDDWVYYWEIVGSNGSKIYPYGKDGTLAVEIQSSRHRSMAERLGLTLYLDCSGEGVYLFTPERIHEVAELIHARKRRNPTPGQIERLRRIGFQPQ